MEMHTGPKYLMWSGSGAELVMYFYDLSNRIPEQDQLVTVKREHLHRWGWYDNRYHNGG